MTSTHATESRFTLVSSNPGLGARAIAVREERRHANDVLAALLRELAADGSSVVAAAQEIGRVLEPESARVELPDLERFFAPNITTEHAPLADRFAGRWREGLVRLEQGLAALALGGAHLGEPLLESRERVSTPRPFTGFAFPLPVVEFLTDPTAAHARVHGQAARFRWYEGDRDTEPRLATAHRVWTGSAGVVGGDADGNSRPSCVLINVHLTTLKAEDEPEPLAAEEGASRVARTRRVECSQAMVLRRAQLAVVRDFIREVVYTKLRLPAIVAGDFNCEPDSLELREFLGATEMESLFETARCWRCGGGAPVVEREFWTTSAHRHVLARSPSDFERVTGTQGLPIRGVACPNCDEFRSTHKRNFGLIDTILVTRRRQGLTARIETERARIVTEPQFSDHFPVAADVAVLR